MIPEDAVLCCDKPAGITSHDLVASIRRELREAGRKGPGKRGPKVGHAGTLDPFATGLLVVLIGRAARLQRYLMALPKTYLATARLGWRSSTGDPHGDLVETGRLPEKLELPTGHIRQRVPMTSAVKVDGERLYRKAHRGETIETPEREVSVYSAKLLEAGDGRARFEIVCSAGTYVRTLIETLDDAYCEELRRIAVGALRVPEEGGRRLVSPAEALAFMPRRGLSEEECAAVGHGKSLPADEIAPPPEPLPEEVVGGSDIEPETVALVAGERLVAVARRRDGELRPEVVLV